MEETNNLQELMDAIDRVVDSLPATRGAIAAALMTDADSDDWSTVNGYREKAKVTYYAKAAHILALEPTEDISSQ